MGALQRGFGQRIQQIRKAKRLTQERLGALADMDGKVVGEIERGERNPTLETIERLLKALGAEPYEPFLFSMKEPKSAGKLDAQVLQNIIQDTDKALHPLILNLLQALLRWDQGKKR